MTKREFLDTVFALAPNEANAIMDAFDEYVDSNEKIDCDKVDKCEKLQLPPANNSEIPNSSDTISRAKAIDAVKRLSLGETDAMRLAMRIGDYLEQLPPAQLSTNLAEVGTDCISRKAAIDAINHELRCGAVIDQCGLETAHDLIEELPSAQPEIIRCGDCKHRMPYDWMFSEIWRSQNIDDYSEDEIGCQYCDMTMKANDFCSRAERREVTT